MFQVHKSIEVFAVILKQEINLKWRKSNIEKYLQTWHKTS